MPADTPRFRIADIIGRNLVVRSLLPAVVCLGLLTAYLGAQQKSAMEEQNARYALSLASFVKGYMDNSWHALGHFVDSSAPRALTDMLAIMPTMERMFWVDAANTVVAVAPPESKGLDFPVRLSGHSQRRLMLSRPVPSLRTGDMTVVIGARSATGVMLAGELNLKELNHYVEGISKAWTGEVIICDRFGNLITHPDPEQVRLQGNIGASPLYQAARHDVHSLVYKEDGAYYLGAAAQVPGQDWLVLVRQRAAPALAPALARVAGATVLMAGVLIGLTVLLRQELHAKISRPMELSAKALAEVAPDKAFCPPADNTFAELGRFEQAVAELTARSLAGRRQLEESEQRFRAIFEQAGVGIVLTDAAGRFLRANAAFLRMTGYTLAELCAMTFKNITHPEDLEASLELIRRVQGNEAGLTALDKRYLTKGGQVVWASLSLAAVPGEAGRRTTLVAVAVDVTARKLAEQAIDASLREKETLLREIHHRVKNNLQIISSLLSLQSDRVSDPETLEQFAVSRNRIASMALIHEELYRSSDLSRVNVRNYVERLAPKLLAAYCTGRPVVCRVQATECFLGIDQAIPFGLIVNELVTNAAKHAFAHDQGGAIDVRVARVDQVVEASVSDDGAGLPDHFNPAEVSTLGFLLVVQLVRQLRGEFHVGQGPGASFCFRFPVKES